MHWSQALVNQKPKGLNITGTCSLCIPTRPQAQTPSPGCSGLEMGVAWGFHVGKQILQMFVK